MDYEHPANVVARLAGEQENFAEALRGYSETLGRNELAFRAVTPESPAYDRMQSVIKQITAAKVAAQELTRQSHAIAATFLEIAEDAARHTGDQIHEPGQE